MSPVDALQATLAGEHAAVYVFGVLGGQVSRSAEPTLATRIDRAYDAHRGRRDRLEVLITAHDARPVASAASYRLPNAAATPAQAMSTARLVERRCVDLYGQLVANSAGGDRGWAITALDTAAVAALGFGAPPADFPGLHG